MTDRLSTTSHEPGDLAALWARHHPRYLQRDTGIRLVRRLYAGELKVPLPKELNLEDKDLLEFGLPTKTMMPLKLTSILQDRHAKLRRSIDENGSPALQKRGTTTELWANAGTDEVLDQDVLVDLLLNEGQCGVVLAISGSHWEERLDFVDLIDDATYSRMEPPARRGYQKRGTKYFRVDEAGVALPKKRFQRDSRGRAPQDGEPFQLDGKVSREMWQEEDRDFKARRFPFICRILPADDCIPIFGPNLTLEGLLVRTSYSTEQLLQRRYSWEKDGSLMIPTGNREWGRGQAPGEMLTLFEGYFKDWQGKPYCTYEVEGASATYLETKSGDRALAVLDLYKEFGLTRLPAWYDFGLHFAKSNIANPGEPLGVPFAGPLITVLLQKEMVANAIALKARWSGFPGFFFKPDTELARDHPEFLLENNKPRVIEIKPMSVTAVPGDIMPTQSPGLGPEIGAIMSIWNEALAEQSPNAAAFGSDGATGVTDRALIEEQTRRSLSMVTRAQLRIVKGVGETLLEYGACYARRKGQPIPIFADIPVPSLNGARSNKTKRGVVELDEDTVGESYDLTAYFPRNFGDNLARTQQVMEAYLKKLMPWREMRETGFEDEAPEETRMEMQLDRYYESDEYNASVLADALQITGDEKEAEKQRLKAQGQLAPDGLPAAAYAGLPMPGQQPGLPPGPPQSPGGGSIDMGMGSPGMAALGGNIGAQVQVAQGAAGAMPIPAVPL